MRRISSSRVAYCYGGLTRDGLSLSLAEATRTIRSATFSYIINMKRLSICFVICLALFGKLNAQQTSTPSSGGSTANTSGANGNSGGSANQGANSSGLQSEAKVLTFNGIADAMDHLVSDVTTCHFITAKVSSQKPAFFFAEPFTSTDVANLFELRRLLKNLNDKMAEFTVSIDGTIATSDMKTLTQYQQTLQMIEKAPGTDATLAPFAAAASTSGSSTSSSTAALPSVPALSGIGADATQIGLIMQAISGMITLANTFHSSATISQGSLGLDQPTINAMLSTRLRRQNCRVFDFTQSWMTEQDIEGDDTVAGYDNTNHDSLLSRVQELNNNISELNKALTLPSGPDKIRPVDLQVKLTTVAKEVTQDLKLAGLTGKNKTMLQGFSSQLQQMQMDMQSVTDGLAILTTASTFMESISGTLAPQYTLNAIQTANAGNTNADKTTTSLSGTAGSSSGITINVNGQSTNQTQGQTQTSSTNSGGGSASTLSTNYVNVIAKFVTIEKVLNQIRWYDRDKNLPMFLISCRVIVGDATEAKVSRYILEDYVALSNRAIVQIQVYNPFTSEVEYSDEAEGTHNYVYFPSRVRDSAENHFKSKDQLNPPYRTKPRALVPPVPQAP